MEPKSDLDFILRNLLAGGMYLFIIYFIIFNFCNILFLLYILLDWLIESSHVALNQSIKLYFYFFNQIINNSLLETQYINLIP